MKIQGNKTTNDSPETIRRRKINIIRQKTARRGLTNADFVKQDDKFKSACEKVNTPPTIRQASKFRNKQGLAYLEGRV